MAGAAAPPAKRTISKPAAGAAKAAGAAAPKAAAGAPKAAAKVKLSKAIVDKVKRLNASGKLAQELSIAKVGARLAELPQAEALEVLDGVAHDPAGCQDPVTWVREAAKALALMFKEAGHDDLGGSAPMEATTSSAPPMDEDWLLDPLPPPSLDNDLAQAETAAQGARPRLAQEVDELAKQMSKKGALAVQVDAGEMRALLAILGELPALEVLKQLEGSKARSVEEQTDFLIDSADQVLDSMRGTVFATRLSRRIRWMNANLAFTNPLQIGQTAVALAGLGEAAAMLVLKRLVRDVRSGEKFEKPTDWVVDVARRVRSGTASVLKREDMLGLLDIVV